ncbi:hypothetical protein EUX98_g3184 [Antrodiella citrinella]|uniref:Uncharacterized protein n=1 Tax=Antrodiella citrinella TaxID=2447956 RepID=A0A4S4MX67_9APHY|nr:hypothetical protein EUX98_g3184 [Antrodiella citrinella]
MSYICEDSDRTAIRSANLTSAVWHYAVRPYIYRMIRIRPYTLDRFEALLAALPTVAYWAEQVEIYSFRSWNGGDPFAKQMLRKWEQLARVVMSGAMKKLTRVVFCDCVFPHPSCYTSKGLVPVTDFWSSFATLDTPVLCVEHVTVPVDLFKTALMALPSLETLHVIRSQLLGGFGSHDNNDDDDDSDDGDDDKYSEDSEDEEEQEVGGNQSGDPQDQNTGDGDAHKPRRSELTALYVSDLHRLRDIVPASSIASLVYLEVDGICMRDRPSRPHPDTLWLFRHLGKNLRTLRLRVLPEDDEDASYGWELSHCTSLHTIELRPITHEAVPLLLDQLTNLDIKHIELPIRFESTEECKVDDYEELNEVTQNFDPSILVDVKFVYMGGLSWEDVDAKMREVVAYPFWIGKGVVTKILKAQDPFGTSYAAGRKIKYGMRKWDKVVDVDDKTPKSMLLRSLEGTRSPGKKKTIAALY